jgi:myo-inositol-1(or 4)-monophosphatase
MEQIIVLEDIIHIAREAGKILLEKFEKPLLMNTKGSDIDLVTEADKESEIYISGELLRLFPDHHLVGEEGGGQGAPIEEAAYHWYVDPLDGTTNFASGIPHFCTSIAMTDAQRNSLLAVVYDPIRDELFSATKNGGATLNSKVIQVTESDTLVKAVVGSGFGYDKHTNPDDNTAQWTAFVKRVRGVRRMGSAALDLAYVAAGRFDAYWEKNLKPWDALAGVLLIQEAGGLVTDYRGGNRPQWDEKGRFVASNGPIHQAMLDVLRESYGW